MISALVVGALLVLGVVWALVAASAGASGFALAAVTMLLTMVGVLGPRYVRRRAAADLTQAPDPHLATIEALAMAIEAREDATPAHARRVQAYAVALAEAVGLTGADVQAVRLGALLHDIGMLAVPEHILSKPAPLTDAEFDTVQQHPRVGADLLQDIPFPQPVAPLVRSHHERWDGGGYPDGLSGDAIPIGARILGVAEIYDALTSDRPYHKAMSREAAVQLLQQEAGSGIDPSLVERFVQILPGIDPRASGGHNTPPPTDQRPNPAADAPVYGAITEAHQEVSALYELARSLGTSLGVSESMTLIAAKLKRLVPYSCCALFLQDADGERLRCRFVSGTDASVIQQVTLKVGEGLSGWVARARKPLVNASPHLDTPAATSLRSALVTPLLFRNRFIGTLALYHGEADFYNDAHSRLAERVAGQIAAVIANSLLFDQAQEDSLTDPLTALPNTRSLFMHLTRELARSKRLRTQLALLVIDLDNFKLINDRHGHHRGDRALCEVARVLRTAIRPYDICVRYAGDEFILVLSGCSDAEAHPKRRDLQLAIGETTIDTGPDSTVRLSASVGVGMYPADGDAYETLLAAADRRMYQDKTRQKHRAAGLHLLDDKTYTDEELSDSASGVL